MSLFPDGHYSGMFIKADMQSVTTCIMKWRNNLPVGSGCTVATHALAIKDAWTLLEPRQVITSRAFLISIGQWTGFFNNDSREFLPQAELFVLCDRLKVPTCFFSYDSSDDTEHRGTAQFNYNYFVSEGKFPVKERQVLLIHDGGWSFKESGEPLPFEESESYKLLPKKMRLTPENLKTYGNILGIPFWDTCAYGNKVTLLAWNSEHTGDDAKALKIIKDIFS